jgi:type II secretory pathway predicted ATPase ExeA
VFTAWVETVYHPRAHSQTGEPPLARLAAADPPPRLPTPAELAEAFLWSEHRTVTKTATVHLHGNVYQVDPALVARRVELVFDPFDLTRVEVRYQGRSMGGGVPHRIDRHTHPHAAASTPPPGAHRHRLPGPRRGRAHRRARPPHRLRRPPRRRPRRPRRRHRRGRHRDGGGRMSIERLQTHYGFSRTPFGRALAPGALHRSRGHAEAVARIGWCVAERALGVLTGEVGAGKTVAIRAALAALDPSRNTIIYLGNPAVGARGLYATIVTALGGTPRFQKAALIPQTADALAAEDHERGRRVTLVVDEAHLLDPDQLEELRLLTNAEMDAHSPFACLLVGQPTLRRRIKLGTFAALDQRIALRYALAGMQPEETKTYLAHHLALAGRTDPMFSDDATALIHQVGRGLPRAVNNLALQALVAAYATNKSIVDESSARAAVTEVTTE